MTMFLFLLGYTLVIGSLGAYTGYREGVERTERKHRVIASDKGDQE